MADIFISYKRDADLANAQKIVRALEAHEFGSRRLTVWWDQNLLGGVGFTRKIFAELKAAHCVLALWSETTPKSIWVGLGEGLEALGLGTLIVVLLDDGVDLPEMYKTIQVVSLAEWNGKASHPKFQELLRSIENMLTTPRRF